MMMMIEYFRKDYEMKKFLLVVIGGVFVSFSAAAQEKDCTGFPKESNGKFEMTPAGPKIVVIAEVPVSFDDTRVLRRARQRAELEAKNKIVKFLEETLASEEKVKELAQETASLTGNQAKDSYDEIIQTSKVLHSQSKAVLRGVVPLDECYTPGKYIRVAVGLKPETIKGAGALAGQINQSLNQNPTRKVGSPDGSSKAASASAGKGNEGGRVDNRESRELRRTEGYGGSGAIDKF